MSPAEICSLLYAGAAILGAVTALISAVQGARPKAGRFEKPEGLDKVLDRFSLLERGAFRNGTGKQV